MFLVGRAAKIRRARSRPDSALESGASEVLLPSLLTSSESLRQCQIDRTFDFSTVCTSDLAR